MLDEANVRLNATALSVFRSACACMSDAPVTVLASSRAQLWCVSPLEAVPATACIFECAAATWFAAWACTASSVDMENFARLQTALDSQAFAPSAAGDAPMSPTSSAASRAVPSSSLVAQNEDTVSALLSFVPACWIRSAFHSMTPNAARNSNKDNAPRADAAVYTVGSSKRHAAAMVPRVLVLSSASSAFIQCLANVVAEHGGRCGSLPDASVFESLASLRGEIVARSVQMPFFTVAPDAGVDRFTASQPVLAETLALFEGSLYKPCVVLYHAAAMWTTADQPAGGDSMAALGVQCVTMTQSSVFLLTLPPHVPAAGDDLRARAQLDAHYCGGARLRLFDLDAVSLCDDGRTLLLVSRNGCSSTRREGDSAVLTSPSVVLRVLFVTGDARAAFVRALLLQCDAVKHAIVVCEMSAGRVPQTVLHLDLNTMLSEVMDIGSAVAVADTDYCASIECATRPTWPVTFPVFADGYEVTEFWKLLSLHTATMLVKLSRIVPTTAHSSLALRVSNCVCDIVGERWGRAYLVQRAATVVANCAAAAAAGGGGGGARGTGQRRDDASLSLQVLRFLVVECCVAIARATTDASQVVVAKDAIAALLHDVEAVSASRPAGAVDRHVPAVRWDRLQEQVLLVMIEGALALNCDSDLTLSVVAPFAANYHSTTPAAFALSKAQAAAATPGGYAAASLASAAPLADLSRLDAYMSTALSSFPSSLFCATHPLPALWRIVRPFLVPVLRSFFNARESFDSMFASSAGDELVATTRQGPGSSVGVRREDGTGKSVVVSTVDAEAQTVDSQLWRLLRDSSAAEVESATAGQLYLNRLFGRAAAIHGDDLSRPSAPLVDDWLQLARLVAPPPHQQLTRPAGSTPNRASTPTTAGGGGVIAPVPLQQPLTLASPSTNSAQQLERRDARIGDLELREQTLQATVSTLHEELAHVRGDITQLLAERRTFRATLLRERLEHMFEGEVSARRVILGQEEVDRCGQHNYLIDRAINESVMLLGDAAYRTLPHHQRMPAIRM